MRSVLNEDDAALDAVHLVALGEQQLGEIGAVLAGDAGDQRAAAHAVTLPVGDAPTARKVHRSISNFSVSSSQIVSGRRTLPPRRSSVNRNAYSDGSGCSAHPARAAGPGARRATGRRLGPGRGRLKAGEACPGGGGLATEPAIDRQGRLGIVPPREHDPIEAPAPRGQNVARARVLDQPGEGGRERRRIPGGNERQMLGDGLGEDPDCGGDDRLAEHAGQCQRRCRRYPGTGRRRCRHAEQGHQLLGRE